MTREQAERMKAEMASLPENIKLIEGTLGPDHLRLVVAGRYVEQLLKNDRLVRYLEKNHGEILGELKQIVAGLFRPEPSRKGRTRRRPRKNASAANVPRASSMLRIAVPQVWGRSCRNLKNWIGSVASYICLQQKFLRSRPSGCWHSWLGRRTISHSVRPICQHENSRSGSKGSTCSATMMTTTSYHPDGTNGGKPSDDSAAMQVCHRGVAVIRAQVGSLSQ